MEKDFRKTYRGIDALFKKMLFYITHYDVRRECSTKWAISLQPFVMIPSPQKFCLYPSILRGELYDFVVKFGGLY